LSNFDSHFITTNVKIAECNSTFRPCSKSWQLFSR